MSERTEASARLYDQVAAELDRAAEHARVAAQHFRDENVPRAAAHAWATYGHMRTARDRLDEQAREHAERSRPHA
jgi:hypothetical protein